MFDLFFTYIKAPKRKRSALRLPSSILWRPVLFCLPTRRHVHPCLKLPSMTIRAVRNLIRLHSPNAMFLSETLLSDCKILYFVAKTGFQNPLSISMHKNLFPSSSRPPCVLAFYGCTTITLSTSKIPLTFFNYHVL